MQAENVQNMTDIKIEEIKIDEPAKEPVQVSIVFVMDASGSMMAMGDEPIQGLNSFYTQQKRSGEFTSTLVFFNHDVTFHHQNIDGKVVPSLSDKDYKRDGMTALYDAIGKSIEYQRKIKTENVIFVILTDGHENSSREYRHTAIKYLITEMEQKHKWTFIYLGANQDSFAVSQGLGIRHSADYDYSGTGCAEIFRTVSDGISRCISHEVPVGEFESDDIKTATTMDPNAPAPDNLRPQHFLSNQRFPTPTLRRS
jgi:hypothetical protein